MEPKKINWKAYEYEHKDNSVDWFWAVGVIAVASAIISIIYGNILFAIFILLGAFTLLMYAVRKPKEINFEINKRGVVVDNTLYPYSTIESFWIREKDNDNERKLVFQSEKILMPHIVIPLSNDIDYEILHEFLSEYLEEEEHHESFADVIMEYLGF
jgi:hypothetical protein